MSQNSGDLRVRRTQKLLREALISLIEERGFDALTVGEIASRAMVSRAAFYRYYQDKYDLAQHIFEDAIATLASKLDAFRQQALSRDAQSSLPPSWIEFFEFVVQSESVPEPWIRFFEFLQEDERFYRVLLGQQGGSWFAAAIRTYLAEVISRRAHLLPLSSKRRAGEYPLAEKLAARLLAGLLVDTITWWLEQGRPCSPSQAATYCIHLIYMILKETTRWE